MTSPSPPRVSVIIPMYNSERYIARAVDSVRRQTYTDWDLWVVDDGSTDSSPEIVRRMTSDRIHYVRRENAGQATARNTGVERSQGELVAFLDADDTWHVSHLELMVEFLDNNPDVGAVGCGLVDGATGRPITWRSTNMYNEGFVGRVNYFAAALERPVLHASAAVVRRSVFQQAGGFLRIRESGEDLEFWARLAIHCPIGYVGDMLATYHTEATGRFMSTACDYPPVVRTVLRAIERGEMAPSQVAAATQHCREQILSYVRRLLASGRGAEARRTLRTDPLIVDDPSWVSCRRFFILVSYLPASVFRALSWVRYRWAFVGKASLIPGGANVVSDRRD